MVNKQLGMREYWWNGSSYEAKGYLYLIDDHYDVSENKWYFSVVRDLKKTEKRAWRIRQTMSSYTARAKIKEKAEMGYTVTGTCSEWKRHELDFYARRKSKFQIGYEDTGAGNTFKIGQWLATPIITGSDTWSDTYDPEGTASEEYGAEKFLVVITDISFSKSEGKAIYPNLPESTRAKNLYDFTIELKRVNKDGTGL